MKRTLIYMFAAMSLVGSSCSGDWLNLNPSTSVTTPQAIRTLEEAQIALNGIYRIAASHSYYGDNYLYYADCRGEDVQARVSKGAGKRVSPYYEFNVTADDALNITRVWNQPYIVIHQANSLLESPVRWLLMMLLLSTASKLKRLLYVDWLCSISPVCLLCPIP